MAYEKSELLNYLQDKRTISVPAVQLSFSMGYREAKKAIDGLVEEKILRYDGGVDYIVVANENNPALQPKPEPDPKKEETLADLRAQLEARRQEILKKHAAEKKQADGEKDEKKDEKTDGDDVDEYIKQRRKALLERFARLSGVEDADKVAEELNKDADEKKASEAKDESAGETKSSEEEFDTFVKQRRKAILEQYAQRQEAKKAAEQKDEKPEVKDDKKDDSVFEDDDDDDDDFFSADDMEELFDKDDDDDDFLAELLKEDEDGDDPSEIRKKIGTFATIKSDGTSLVFTVPNLKIDDAEVSFELGPWGNDEYLMDGGFARSALEKELPYSTELESMMAAAVKPYGVEVFGRILRTKVTSAEEVTAQVMNLYAAMARIARIDKAEVSTHIEDKNALEKCAEIFRKHKTLHTLFGKDEALLAAKEALDDAKKGYDVDEVLVCAKAVKLIAGLTQEEFERYASAEEQADDRARALAEVSFASVQSSEVFRRIDPKRLKFVIGRDDRGQYACSDFRSMSHLLVRGGKGTGIAWFLSNLMTSLITTYTPEEVRLLPAYGEAPFFSTLEMPHLLTGKTIAAEPKEFLRALKWAINEMERRYTLLFSASEGKPARMTSIEDYNASCKEGEEKLPKIVFIGFEIAPLLGHDRAEAIDCIRRLAQKSRAAGIYLVFSTDDDSVAEEIGQSFPSWAAFGEKGDAEAKRAGMGLSAPLFPIEMIYSESGKYDVERIHCAKESGVIRLRGIVNARKIYESNFDEYTRLYIHEGFTDPDERDLHVRALSLAIHLGQVSMSLLQRKLGIGYNRAGKIVDWMVAEGYVAPLDKETKARKVLITMEEFVKKFGPLD